MRSRRGIAVAAAVLSLFPVLFANLARAQTEILKESLQAKPADTRVVVHGGSYSAEGWKVVDAANWIEVDLGHGINAGKAEVDVKRFNPNCLHATDPTNCPNPEDYCPVFSLFEQGNIGHGDGMTTHAFEAVTRTDTKRIKLCLWGPCMVNCEYIDHDFAWKDANVYHVTSSWDAKSVTFQVEDKGQPSEGSGSQTRSWTCSIQPNFRYLYLAHNHSPYSPIKDAVYSNLVVTELPDPCEQHCTNGKQDCGEEGIDCSGGCAACSQTDAAPPQDAAAGAGGTGGVSGTGGQGGGVAAGSGGAISKGGAGGTSKDASASPTDASAGGASGAAASGASDDGGCSCRASGERRSGSLALLAVGAIAFRRRRRGFG